jgi:hypothetical protein
VVGPHGTMHSVNVKSEVMIMKKLLLLSLLILTGIFLHDVVRLAVSIFIKSQYSANYVFNLRYFIFVAFINLIPYLLVCGIALSKVKDTQNIIDNKRRTAGIITSAVGVVIVNVIFFVDYWIQLLSGTATSTISLGLPLISIVLVALVPVFYWFGKKYLAK